MALKIKMYEQNESIKVKWITSDATVGQWKILVKFVSSSDAKRFMRMIEKAFENGVLKNHYAWLIQHWIIINGAYYTAALDGSEHFNAVMDYIYSVCEIV